MNKFFEKFKKSDFNLQIWSEGKAIFHSEKSGIQGLLEFIRKNEKTADDLTVFDTKVGNAAALLFVYLKVKEVYGIVGSQNAARTLAVNNIKFYFSETIPNILNREETDICPMEKLSFSETPESFLELSKLRFTEN